MKIFTSETVAVIDDYTIKNEPIESIDLMERASSRLAWWYTRYFKINRNIAVFAGPGNNGGDALALARILIQRQYTVDAYLVSSSGKLSDDCKTNLDRLEKDMKKKVNRISNVSDFPKLSGNIVIVDGIFGSGLSRIAGGIYGKLIQYINSTGLEVVSIDIPSGLFGEDNRKNDPGFIIHAGNTLTFQFPFLSFFFVENAEYTGRWHVLDIGLNEDIIERTDTNYTLLTRRRIANLIHKREKFSHKGTYGNALCVVGSYGMMGAAVLTGEAVLRSGAGLVTLHVPGKGYQIVQTAFPEAIVSVDPSDNCFSRLPDLGKYSAVAVGPGLGTHQTSKTALMQLFEKVSVPLVIDADALNMIAGDAATIRNIPGRSILTPHPAEFDRIAGSSDDAWTRHEKQIEFSVKNNVTVVLKGAYTGISFPNGNYVFNTTGNPGMATGGSGDVLTGIIVSLLAQGMEPEDAAMTGVYLHGMAGDLAAEKNSAESMIAGDITKQLGAAFEKIKSKPFLHEGRKGGVVQ
ncbi:MAG: NAD(P)H-hydrate dehydratase [Bacteroidales bacterium]|nr:NAD(P)H-hydrate dehydratase [Bacteroidales bacterium]